MRVLVIGEAGCIVSHTVDALVERGYRNRLQAYDYEWFGILADGTPRPYHQKEE